jgi:hypothetical protein
MSYFDDLIDSAPIERELSVRGKTVPTWWKPLTAGQRVELLRGQVVKSDGESASVVEVDLAQSAERSQRMVVMTLCTQDGQAVYRALKDCSPTRRGWSMRWSSLRARCTTRETARPRGRMA